MKELLSTFTNQLNEIIGNAERPQAQLQSAPTEYSEWETYPLDQLLNQIEATRQDQKYLFVWDKHGNVGTFMNYKGMQVELGPEIIKTALGRQDIDQTSELIRKKWIWAMRAGDKLCFDIE